MTEPDNPAARLLAFIHDLGESGGGSVAVAISKIYGIDPNDKAALFRAIAEIVDLPRQLRIAIESTPELPAATYVKALPDIEKWLSFLDNLQQGVTAPFDTLGTVLELISGSLSMHRPEVLPPWHELLEIRGEAEALLHEVVNADLDSNLRLFMADQLRNLIAGIDTFRISGIAPVRAAVAQFLGEVILRKGQLIDLSEDSTEKTLFHRVWGIADRLSVAVTLAPGTIELVHMAMHSLGAG